ncbi:hypothetical protein QR680_002509 [Steinernema hermaphroditum]|uniref:BZIP domain-containing protein n=1 Tax=Steinernema hermaphroditum TaxID=289476 RepID=A0AA39H5P2_9BILA|nr:hypothetical protein QR680_002509 [Steinernema hermaphroditum]
MWPFTMFSIKDPTGLMWTGSPVLTSTASTAYCPNITAAISNSTFVNEPSTSSLFDALGDSDWTSLNALKNTLPNASSTLSSIYPSYLGLLPACDIFANPSVVPFNETCSPHVPYTSHQDVVPRASLSPIGALNYLGLDRTSVHSLTPMPPVVPTPQIVPSLAVPAVSQNTPVSLSSSPVAFLAKNEELALEAAQTPQKTECIRVSQEETASGSQRTDGQNEPPVFLDLVDIVVQTARRMKPLDDDASHNKAILERKRKQNKIAAANYRNRQKDKRERMLLEINELAEKNSQLQEVAADLEAQIAEYRSKLLNLDGQ